LKSRESLGPAKLVLRDVVTIDGVRAIFDDGWGLIRASNTQPALVLRFEATSPEKLATIRAVIEGELKAAKQALGC
jgi:phosphomannomutase/phosphoglucomutase